MPAVYDHWPHRGRSTTIGTTALYRPAALPFQIGTYAAEARHPVVSVIIDMHGARRTLLDLRHILEMNSTIRILTLSFLPHRIAVAPTRASQRVRCMSSDQVQLRLTVCAAWQTCVYMYKEEL